MSIDLVKEYPYISVSNHTSGGFELNNSDSTDLLWITNGPLNCTINFEPFTIPSYTILVLDKETSFTCKIKNATSVKVLRFNTEIFSSSIIFACGFINTSLKNNAKSSTILFFNSEQAITIENSFHDIEQLLRVPSKIDIDKLKKKVCSLLKEEVSDKLKKQVSFVNHFASILNNQYSIYHNVSDYAFQLNMAPKNLLLQFQKCGLENPSHIIRKRLLTEAKQLLVYTDKTVREICFDLGFYDPAYFSRFFKKNTGMTTQLFRKLFPNGFASSLNGKKCNKIEM